MSCRHAHTTTLAWLYGEGPEEHASHIASCGACQHAVALHEGVMARVFPVTPRASLEVGAPGHRRWGGWALAVVALAAGVLIVVQGLATRPPVAPEPEVAAIHPTPARAMSNQLDEDLEHLDLALDALAYDLSTL